MTAGLLFQQSTVAANVIVGELCFVQECQNVTDVQDQLQIIKTIDATDLMKKVSEIGLFLGPIPFDGEFYTENVEEKFQRGNLSTNISYVVGLDSYEGMLLSWGRKNFTVKIGDQIRLWS